MSSTTKICIDDEEEKQCHPYLNLTCSSDRVKDEKSVSTCSQEDLAINVNIHADSVTAPGTSFKECDGNFKSTDTFESEEVNHKSNEADSLEDNKCNIHERSNIDDKNTCTSEILAGETISTPDISSEHAVHYLHSENFSVSDRGSSNKVRQNSSEICQPSLETGKGDSSRDQVHFQQANEVPKKGLCSTKQEQAAADNSQHELSGPISRRQEARQQRRVAANPATRFAIPAALNAQWREIGFEWGLDNDNDIARVLLQHYEDVQAGRPPRLPPPPRCRGCGERMRPGPCTHCGPDKHHLRFDKDEHKGGNDRRGGFGNGGFDGGRSGFCGHCRD